jgi:signal transduction histidine kinase
MLHDFLVANRGAVIERCRARVAHRLAPRPIPAGMEHGVPALLGQLIDMLGLEQQAGSSVSARSGVALGAAGFHAQSLIAATAARHGHELLAHGFATDQVVHDYGDLGQVVAEMAAEARAPIPPEAFETLARCLDHATAEAVTAFCHQRERLLAGAGNRAVGERLGLVTEELRGHVNNALQSFVAIKEGGVGLHGATAGILERSLVGLNDLVTQVLVDVRLATGAPSRLDHVAAERLVEEVRIAAGLEARSRGCELTVFPVERGLAFEADRQMLLSAVLGLLHNALERSLPQGQVWLKAHATASRVLFEVEDQGGALTAGRSARMATAPEGASGHGSSGVGLDISRLAVQAMGGKLGFRDIAGVGCVVIIDLPRGAPQAASNVSQRTDQAAGDD